tara:strand:- start:2881 stop:3864 length:984 start_codon:yes stop_codon:yes gene_type:complete
MKAAWYTKIGEAKDVLKVGELDDPIPVAGEVLVKVKASGINPSDVKTRAGARGELQFPRVIPHSDGSGKIIDVGEGVDKNRIGEKVWIWNGAFGRANGTCAELISLPELQAVKINNEVSYESAACMGIPASTAYYGVLANGPVKNKTVLISGGAGAVGFYGIQLAKLSGANVITTISNDEKAKVASDAGADKIINYKNENVLEEIMEYTNKDGVDRIFEVEFGGNLPINEKIIKSNGVIATYGSMAEMEPKLPFYNLMFKGVKIDTFLIYSIEKKDREEILNGLSELLNQNSLKHMISKTYSIDEVIDAHEAMESGAVVGNIVITFD